MIEYTPQNQIDGRYFEDLKRHSPAFRKEYRLTNKELALGIAYYRFKEQGGRIIAHQTEILKMKLSKIELAYWKYHLVMIASKEYQIKQKDLNCSAFTG